jgi:MoxR-like ATPase
LSAENKGYNYDFNPEYDFEREIYKDLKLWLQTNEVLFLEGIKGCGKTHIVKKR